MEALMRLQACHEQFDHTLLSNPELAQALPERFVLAVLPLDDPEAARLAIENLPRLQGWSREEGPLVHALFMGGELVAVVLEGRVIPTEMSRA